MSYDAYKLRSPEDEQHPDDRPYSPSRRGVGPDRSINGPCVPCAREKKIAVSVTVLHGEAVCEDHYQADEAVVQGLAEALRDDEIRDDALALAGRGDLE